MDKHVEHVFECLKCGVCTLYVPCAAVYQLCFGCCFPLSGVIPTPTGTEFKAGVIYPYQSGSCCGVDAITVTRCVFKHCCITPANRTPLDTYDIRAGSNLCCRVYCCPCETCVSLCRIAHSCVMVCREARRAPPPQVMT
jgi:hypothetical protein